LLYGPAFPLSAETFAKEKGCVLELNAVQQKILDTLSANGPMEPNRLSEMLQIKETDLEREIAALRHMEKVRGELRGGKRVIRLW
jgi:predicted HTH transcriptional regulator